MNIGVGEVVVTREDARMYILKVNEPQQGMIGRLSTLVQEDRQVPIRAVDH